jgi:hypothetical protein
VSLAPAAVPHRHPRVVEAPVAGDLALFHLDDRRLHLLNPTAAAIWAGVDTAPTVAALTRAVAEAFGVDPAAVGPDVERTLDRLRVDGLLTLDRAARPSSPPLPWADPEPAAPVATPAAPAAGSWAALDARLALACDDAELSALVASVLAPLRSPEPATTVLRVDEVADGWEVGVDGARPVVVGSRLAAAMRVVGEVNSLAVASVPGHLVLHAGAVTDGRGAALLPGVSNAGKSTLTAALVRAGLGYLTDEAAAVDETGEVRPFPKAIALDPGSFDLFPDLAPGATTGLAGALASREWHVDPGRVGVTGPAGRVRVVICPRWRAGSSTRLHRLAPAEALHVLLGEAFDFAGAGPVVFPRLARLVETVPVYRLGYGDLDAAAATVQRLLGDPGSV